MEGSEGEGIFSGRHSTKEGGVSLLCIWNFLGGRGFVEGSEVYKGGGSFTPLYPEVSWGRGCNGG